MNAVGTSRHSYDHRRLRTIVNEIADASLLADLDIPRSTLARWMSLGPIEVVTTDLLLGGTRGLSRALASPELETPGPIANPPCRVARSARGAGTTSPPTTAVPQACRHHAARPQSPRPQPTPIGSNIPSHRRGLTGQGRVPSRVSGFGLLSFDSRRLHPFLLQFQLLALPTGAVVSLLEIGRAHV